MQRSPCARQKPCKLPRFGFQKRRPGRPGESPGEQNRGRTGQVRAQNARRTQKDRPRAPDEREERPKIEKNRPGVRNPAALAAPVWNYSIGSLGGALRAPLDVRDKVHAAAAEAAAAEAAPAAALAAAPAADLWIHGSIFFIMNHIFELAVKSTVESAVEFIKNKLFS